MRCRPHHCARIILTFLIGFLLVAPRTAGAQESQPPDNVSEFIAWTVPAIALNTVPGFGLGSLGQGDRDGFRRGLILDVIGIGLIAGSAALLNSQPADDPGGVEVLSLLTGYGVYAYARGAAIVRPVRWSWTEGIGTDRAFAPAFYNTIPGFGLGSNLQGDRVGASVLGVSDGIAFAMVGVVSFAALGGLMTTANVAGVTFLASYGFARVYGILRPAIYLRRGERDHSLLLTYPPN